MTPARNFWNRAQSFSASSGGEKSTQCLFRNSSSVKPSIAQNAGLMKRGCPSRFSTTIPIGLVLKISWNNRLSSKAFVGELAIRAPELLAQRSPYDLLEKNL